MNFYAIVAYRSEVISENTRYDLADTLKIIDSRQEEQVINDEESVNPMKNSFSDQFGTIALVQQNKHLKRIYNFEAHSRIHERFNAWCGRCFVAFLCQICIALVTTYAIRLSR